MSSKHSLSANFLLRFCPWSLGSSESSPPASAEQQDPFWGLFLFMYCFKAGWMGLEAATVVERVPAHTIPIP